MMKERIALQRRDVGEDSVGQPLATWAPIATVWSDVRFQSGAEVLRAGGETSIVKCSIRIRARSDIGTAARVEYKGKHYDIQSALPDSQDPRFMFLVCEASK